MNPSTETPESLAAEITRVQEHLDCLRNNAWKEFETFLDGFSNITTDEKTKQTLLDIVRTAWSSGYNIGSTNMSMYLMIQAGGRPLLDAIEKKVNLDTTVT